jgi:hypothetical protein
MLKWNNLLLLLILILIWEISVFPLLFQSVFVDTKFKKHFPADLVSNFSENSNLVFVLFYQEIINTISPEFSRTLLFRFEYPISPNPIMCMMTKISYI